MEQEFSLTSELQNDCLIIATSGYINNNGGKAIADEFGKHFLGGGIKKVVVNLAQTKVVNSIGMSFLIEIIERLEEAGGRLVFTNVDPGVDKMLTIMGLFTFAAKEKSVADALKLLSA